MRRTIRQVINTNTLAADANDMLGGAAIARDGSITGWHVTSQPDVLLSDIVKGRIFDDAHAMRELGPGLYVSAVPRYWLGRAGKTGEVLLNLTKRERTTLAKGVIADVRRLTSTGYITRRESDQAHRMVSSFMQGNNESMVIVAGQPWNVPMGDQSWLESHGLGHRYLDSVMVEIQAKGRFVEVSRSLRGNEWKRLARTFDGAIKRNTMTTNPEAVIWNVDAITHVGSPESVR